MHNSLAKNFKFLSLMKFTLPTMIMMVFMSLYTMIDGIFVAQFIGTSALSAVNIVYPLLNIVIAIGIMLATGGSAVVATQMGEGKKDNSRESFSLIIYFGIFIGVAFAIIGLLFIDPLITLLGANASIYNYCFSYSYILIIFAPLGILQMLFQYFFVTAGKPTYGLIAIIVGGCANIILDYVFIVPLNMGIAGAALATGIGFSIPAIFGLLYFTYVRNGTLYLVKLKIDKNVIWQSCANGSSEMVTNISIAITTFLFNVVMMQYLGEDGVAAITIVLYAQYLLTAIFLGYSSGVSPVLSYNYGEKNTVLLKRIFKISMIFVTACSIIVYGIALLLAPYIVTIFTKVGTNVYTIANNGFSLFAIAFLFMGMNIFASALFTALSNGKVSAIISFVRTFFFMVTCIILLPYALGVDGIWLSVPLAETLALVVSLGFIGINRKNYNYI